MSAEKILTGIPLLPGVFERTGSYQSFVLKSYALT